MPTFYADVSAVGNEYQAYANTPVWGALATDKPLPMDGNGKAGPGHSAAVAIAEISCVSITAVAGNTLTIAGTVLTAVASGATTTQFNAGTGATLAANLVAAINAASGAVSSTACAAVLPLRYWCFARISPSNTSIVQIATRIAGTNLNHADNSAVAILSTGIAPTITQFAGGADGPFGYIANAATVFNKTLGTYGLYFAAAPGPTNPGAADIVNVRTQRDSVSLGVTLTSPANLALFWQTRVYVYDDGTVWSGDNGKFKFDALYTNASTGSLTLQFSANVVLSHISRTFGKFQMGGGATVAAAGFVQLFLNTTLAINARISFINSIVEESANTVVGVTNLQVFHLDGGGSGVYDVHVDATGSLFRFRGRAKPLVISSGASAGSTLPYSLRAILNGTTVEIISALQAIEPFIIGSGATSSFQLEWIGGAVRDTNNIFNCTNPIAWTSKIIIAEIDSVTGLINPSIGFTPTANTINRFVWSNPEGANSGYRLETPQYTIDWKNDNTFPYEGNAANLRGANWSHRVAWTAAPSKTVSVSPVKLAYFYRDTATIKTITVELYVPDTTTFYKDELEFEVSYVDSANVQRIESVPTYRFLQIAGARVPLDTSLATWTPNGLSDYSAKKLSLTTSQPIKPFSEIGVRLSFCAARTPTIAFYISPELGVS